jgi:hypothetical protein
MNSFWTEKEIDYLISNFTDKTNFQISIDLNRSIKSITSKANKMGLKKSKSHRSKMISHRNKISQRNLTDVLLKKLALQYKTRAEFQYCDASAYTTARVRGLLDDICSHMIKISYSIPQMILSYILKKLLGDLFIYNDRKTISPYELDIYYYEYRLAFEYNGKGWHNDKKIDKYKICDEKKIKLITIIENNRNYTDDIKDQLISNLHIINRFSGLDITSFDVKNVIVDHSELFSEIIDEFEIKKICDKYDDYSNFCKENIKLYNKLRSLKLLEKFTKHMKKRGGITYESAKIEVSKYTYFSDFFENSHRFYVWIKKYKKEKLLEPLILKQNKKLKYPDSKSTKF